MNRRTLITALTASLWLPASPASAAEGELGTQYEPTLKHDTRVFRAAMRNFTYKRDEIGRDIWERIKGLGTRWIFDCEGFAFSLQWLLGGTVWHAVLHRNGAHHAVLMKDGYVFDYEYAHPIPAHTYQKFYGKFVEVMVFKHRKSLGKG